ncbi:MAG: 16S rRNA (uracil(1498)-N(3))-methyltransferase [Dehalococcoidales bacterium]|nr:16S rRNA (uracil(1498)-N(3))-methyltransferase [Dehalococcoidales bacterium]
MRRFYIEQISGDKVALSDADQLHHIRDVLRLKAGDIIIVFDHAGKEYKAKIASADRKQVELNLTPLKARRTSPVKLTVACAVPRAGRMDDIVDHLTQLGVARIIPVLTDRVVVKLDTAARESRLSRWQKIAQSAARQCQRSSVPVISPVTDVKEVIESARDFDLKLIPHLTGERKLIRDVLAASRPKNVLVLIGPEGDFTPEEVESALHNDFIPVSLGDTVLRVAAAAIAVTAYIRFALDK